MGWPTKERWHQLTNAVLLALPWVQLTVQVTLGWDRQINDVWSGLIHILSLWHQVKLRLEDHGSSGGTTQVLSLIRQPVKSVCCTGQIPLVVKLPRLVMMSQ